MIAYSRSEKVFNVFNICFMVLLLIVTVYPMLHILFGSISDPKQLLQHSGLILKPMGFDLQAYKIVLTTPSILNGFLNSLWYTAVGTSLSMLLTIMGAYVLSRKHLMLNGVLTFIVVFTMFFSGGLIPLYLQVKSLNLIGSRWAVILPYLVSTWNLIVMRTSFQGLPEGLIESAKIDGANDFVTLFRIVVPLSMATIAAISLFYAVGYWNDWFAASIYLKDRNDFPLQLFLREILIASQVQEAAKSSAISFDTDLYRTAIKYTTIIVSTVPILLVYPFLQKYFVKGVLIGSIKG